MSRLLRRLLAAELAVLVVLALVYGLRREGREQAQLERRSAAFLAALGRADDAAAFGPPNLRLQSADRLLEQVAQVARRYRERDNIAAIRDGLARPADAKLQALVKLMQNFDVEALDRLNRNTAAGRAKARGMLYGLLGELYRLRYTGLRLGEAQIDGVAVVPAGKHARGTVRFRTPTGKGTLAWVRHRKVTQRGGYWELDVTPDPPASKPGRRKP